jgi:hypothetical protein
MFMLRRKDLPIKSQSHNELVNRKTKSTLHLFLWINDK